MLLLHSVAVAWLFSASAPIAAPRMATIAPLPADTGVSTDSLALQFPDTSHYQSPGGGIPIEYLSTVQPSVQPTQTPGRPLPATTPVVRVLFIGNSSIFSNMMPRMFHDIMVTNGHPCVVGMVTMGGATLEELWDAQRAARVIRDYPWDYVVLQEKTGGEAVNFLKYATRFQQEIAAHHAQTILYPQYYQNVPGQRAVEAANRVVAKALQATVAPITAVWDAALASDTTLDLFENDGFHPSPRGAYLNAWMMYQLITGESPMGRSTAGNSRIRLLPDSVAAILQRAAATVGASPTSSASRRPLGGTASGVLADSNPASTALTAMGAKATHTALPANSVVLEQNVALVEAHRAELTAVGIDEGLMH